MRMRRGRGWWICVTVMALAMVARDAAAASSPPPTGRRQATPLILFWVAPQKPGELTCALMDRQGHSRHLIAASTGVAASEWNPNGRAFTYLGNDGQLRVYDVASGRSVTVRAGDRYVDAFAHFPDGERLLISWTRRDRTGAFLGGGGLAVVHLQSGRVQWISRAIGVSGAYLSGSGTCIAGESEQGVVIQRLTARGELRPRGVLVKRQGQYVASIAWSPNDRYIAVHWVGIARRTSDPAGKTVQERVDEAARARLHELWVYSADGKHGWRVWTGTGGGLSVTWHPNSRRLALVTLGAGSGASSLRFADLANGKWHTSSPTPFGGTVYLGGWSADGRSFAYSFSAHDESRIFVAGPEAEHAVAVSPAGARDLRPTWQPRGWYL
jgi:Tol biopolymer transport system component